MSDIELHPAQGTFLCAGTLRNVARTGGSIAGTLKRASILSETVVVELWDNAYYRGALAYDALRTRDLSRYLAVAASGALDPEGELETVVSEYLADETAFQEIFLDINGDHFFNSPKIQNLVSAVASSSFEEYICELERWVARDWAQRELGDPDLAERLRPGEDADSLEEMALVDLLQDLGMATAVSLVAPDVRPLLSERYRGALDVVEGRSGERSSLSTSCDERRSLYIADPAELSWGEILEARADSRVKGFWGHVRKLSGEADLVTQREIIEALEQETVVALNEVVRKQRAKPLRTAIEALLGLLPIPVINPFGLLFSARAVKESIDMEKRYSWLYFVQDHIPPKSGVLR